MGCAPNNRLKQLQQIRRLPIQPPVMKADSVTSIQTNSIKNLPSRSPVKQKWIEERETSNLVGKENKGKQEIVRFTNQGATKMKSNPSPADLKGHAIQEKQKVIQISSRSKEVTAMRAPPELAIPYFESEQEVEPDNFKQIVKKQAPSLQLLRQADLKVKENNSQRLTTIVMDFTRKVVLGRD